MMEWTDNEKQELLTKVADAFFNVSKLGVSMRHADGSFSVDGPSE